MLKLVDILEALSGTRFEHASEVITDAVIDSRLATRGSLFIALPGERVDGHDYVKDAFNHGAHIALVQRDLSSEFPVLDLRGILHPDAPGPMDNGPFCILVEDSLQGLQQIARYWRRQLNLRVIGITGSIGKSTTKEVVAAVLSQRYQALKNPGNLNNEIGLPLTLLKAKKSHEKAVLEMGFYQLGEIAFLCDLALPQVGVVTNVGTVHAERVGSQEAIARSKTELVQALPPAPEGVAILNYDDPWVREMAKETQARVFFYGLDPNADLWADRVEGLGLEGIRFRLHYRKEVLHLRVPLIGRHSVHTVLRATAVGLVEGLTWQEIVNGLRSRETQLRLMVVHAKNGALILDDTYNASPESTLAALNLLEELEGRKVAVLGDMLELGPYEKRGHEMVGARAAEIVDELITVGRRGRMIADAARQAGLANTVIKEVEDSREAITYLTENLNPADIVLVKGSRGMKMESIVGTLEAR
jgi:UDP-N-acetylmuramoyl-tripeptide--D-alanyl-D-alanine ligase